MSAACPEKIGPGVSSMRRIALVVNPSKAGACELALELADIARARGLEVVQTDSHPVPEDFLTGCDACCVLGGDGTILGAVASALNHRVPIFGINRGKLGFLANYPAESATRGFVSVLDGDYRRAEVSLLECETADGRVFPALNDIVIKTREVFRMARLCVHDDHGFVNTYRGDGLIFSTPTGSTAYNLGAGGPLILPEAAVFVMTPICPHTLTNRAVIFPACASIRVEKEAPSSRLVVSVDGHDPLAGNLFPLSIRSAQERLPILRPKGMSHFDILRAKLNW